MKFVKKFLLVFIMLFALTAFIACGGDDNKNNVEDLLKESIVVNFDTQGGSAIEKVTIKVSEAASFKLPADPTKDGYAFIGWYLDSNYATAFDKLEAKAGEVKLYAKWETVSSSSVVVKFESNGGSTVANVVVNANTPDLSSFKVPTKDGEIFLGWFTDAALTKAVRSEDITKALSAKEITLYAKWGKEGELSNAGLSVTAKFDVTGSASVDELKKKAYEGGGQATAEVVNHTASIEASVSVNVAVASLAVSKFEDLGVAVVISAMANGMEDDQVALELPKTDIKLYLQNGVVYALVPGALLGSETDLGVKVDLVQVYNDNITTVTDYVKELVAMLKELPAEELPEGFDLSVLDRIDLDNFKLEDLLALVELIPDEYKEVIENPEELSIDSVLGLVKEALQSYLGLELTDEEMQYVETLINDVLEILKGLVPTVTTNGNTTKIELTDKQVKDTVTALETYLKEHFNDIYTFATGIMAKMYGGDTVYEDEPVAYNEGTDGEEPAEDDEPADGEEPTTDEPFDMSEYVIPMIEAYAAIIKESLKINKATVEVTTNGLFPTNVKAELDVEIHFDASKHEMLGLDPEDKLDANLNAALNVDVAILTTAIEYPDFTTFMDVTEYASAAVASMLEEAFSQNNVQEYLGPEEAKAKLESQGYNVLWTEAGDDDNTGLVGTLSAIKGIDVESAIIAYYYETPEDAQAAYEKFDEENESDLVIMLYGDNCIVMGLSFSAIWDLTD